MQSSEYSNVRYLQYIGIRNAEFVLQSPAPQAKSLTIHIHFIDVTSTVCKVMKLSISKYEHMHHIYHASLHATECYISLLSKLSKHY